MEWLLRQLRKAMNPRTYVLLGFFVAVLLWMQALENREKALRAALVAAGAPPGATAVPAVATRHAKPEAVGPGWGEDPFARRFTAAGEEGIAHPAQRTRTEQGAAKATGLYLQGVMSGPMGRTALINGSVVREGERIGTREVLQIGRRSVVLLENGTVVTLFLQGEGR